MGTDVERTGLLIAQARKEKDLTQEEGLVQTWMLAKAGNWKDGLPFMSAVLLDRLPCLQIMVQC